MNVFWLLERLSVPPLPPPEGEQLSHLLTKHPGQSYFISLSLVLMSLSMSLSLLLRSVLLHIIVFGTEVTLIVIVFVSQVSLNLYHCLCYRCQRYFILLVFVTRSVLLYVSVFVTDTRSVLLYVSVFVTDVSLNLCQCLCY